MNTKSAPWMLHPEYDEETFKQSADTFIPLLLQQGYTFVEHSLICEMGYVEYYKKVVDKITYVFTVYLSSEGEAYYLLGDLSVSWSPFSRNRPAVRIEAFSFDYTQLFEVPKYEQLLYSMYATYKI